uniref:Uncharacterized protein n=1 Tax=Arabidopsis thaliana TaxID=3702 RepID=Q1PE77_ARATH|nr:hypothetical protein At4g16090 [Arabidopsis thaliana]
MKLLSETRYYQWSCVKGVWSECPMVGEFSRPCVIIMNIKPYMLLTTTIHVAPNLSKAFLCIPLVNL